MCDYFCAEPTQISDKTQSRLDLDYFADTNPGELHRALPGFRPTPLHRLKSLAGELGVDEVYVKDESHRLGLNAFKILGASWAMYRWMQRHCREKTGSHLEPADLFDEEIRSIIGKVVFSTATDGNHGRAVAWMARVLKQSAVIYMPSFSVHSRVENIRKEGAEVALVDGGYDEAVKRADEDGRKYARQIISDTAYDGYTEIPKDIAAGYQTLFQEIDHQLTQSRWLYPDIVFIQAGVGALAAAAGWHYNLSPAARKPNLISVEPSNAACILNSVRAGRHASLDHHSSTSMAGLNCATPSITAFPVIRSSFRACLAIPDSFAVEAMKRYYRPVGNDPRVISGESGAAGLGSLLALVSEGSLGNLRHHVDLKRSSRILLVNTEGDTDPEAFERIMTSK